MSAAEELGKRLVMAGRLHSTVPKSLAQRVLNLEERVGMLVDLVDRQNEVMTDQMRLIAAQIEKTDILGESLGFLGLDPENKH